MSDLRTSERQDASVIEFARDARRSNGDAPVVTRRRTLEMQGLHLDLHALKHLLDPDERWDEVIGSDVPARAPEFRRARMMGLRTQVSEGVWSALERLSPAEPSAVISRLSSTLLIDEIEWVKSCGAAHDFESLAQMCMFADLVDDSDGNPSQFALEHLVPEKHWEDARQRWKPATSALAEEVLFAMCEEAGEPFSDLELAVAAELRKRAQNTNLVELAEYVRAARDRTKLEEEVADELRRLESARPRLRAEYRMAAGRALAEAGAAPRHCIYDRGPDRACECYIDQHGVTVCQSPERGEEYRLRTAYRVRHGRTGAERRLEAAEAAAFSRRSEPIKALKKFVRTHSRDPARAAIRQTFTEERWLQVD